MKIQTTPLGYTKNKEEYDTRIAERSVILEELQRARDLGDLSENGAYHAAREKQSFNEGKIKELEYFFKNAVIVEKVDTEEVQLGSIVTIELNGLVKEYSMVGSDEADLSNGKLSIDSPVGMALLGKRKNDNIVISTPAGDVSYKIIGIE